MPRVSLLVGWCVLAAFVARADEAETQRLAEAFSAYPALWKVRLSPDGTKTAQIQAHADGTTLLTVIDVAEGSSTTVMSATAGETVIEECGWANDTRLLCSVGIPFVARPVREMMPSSSAVVPVAPSGRVSAPVRLGPPPVSQPSVTAIAAVNSDGTEPAELLILPRTSVNLPVVDWLPDDPRAVLVRLDRSDGPLAKLDVYSGATTVVTDIRGWTWFTDGRGTPRVYSQPAMGSARWYVRSTPSADWAELEQRTGLIGDDRFLPYGLITDGTELLYVEPHDDVLALFALDLASRATRVVASESVADVRAVTGIGPTRRPAYASFGWGQRVFDAKASEAIERVRPAFPDHEVGVIDESADGSRHVFFVKPRHEAGAYYHYDAGEKAAALIATPFPALSEIELASTRTVALDAGKGSILGGVLFEPYAPSTRRSAVVLTWRDETLTYPDLDTLAEFLAAHGHVVLRLIQSWNRNCNAECARERSLGTWSYPVDEIAAAATWLAESGLAESENICVVGKGTGRYLALAASARHPDRFRCAASIGNTVPVAALGRVGGTNLIHVPSENVTLRRIARDLERPTFLAFASGESVGPATPFIELIGDLRRSEKPHVAIEYEPTESAMHVQVDLLTQLAQFLSDNLD